MLQYNLFTAWLVRFMTAGEKHPRKVIFVSTDKPLLLLLLLLMQSSAIDLSGIHAVAAAFATYFLAMSSALIPLW